MKKLILFFAAIILGGFSATATTNLDNNTVSTFYRGYGNSFIFVENGIEFSVFPDGQFDFNILRYQPDLAISIGNRNANITFNSGFNYNAYVQYDEFGAIIQIENTPIFYDFYGRVVQAGNVNIFYNNFGRINRIGGLYIHYNRFNRFSHYTGFINRFNRSYVFRPWHRFYSIPAIDYCVVYNRPYRRFYNPVRYVYNRPFRNNYRPITAIASRRGNTIIRNRTYATVNRSARNRTKVNNIANTRRSISRDNTIRKNNSRRIANNNDRSIRNNDMNRTNSRIQNRGNSTMRRDNSTNNRNSQYRTRGNGNQNVIKKRSTTTVRQAPKRNSSQQVTRYRTTTVVKKPKANSTRIYDRKSTNRSSGQTVTRSSRSTKPASRVARNTGQVNSRATQGRSTSRNNNTSSNSTRRRR